MASESQNINTTTLTGTFHIQIFQQLFMLSFKTLVINAHHSEALYTVITESI